VEACIRQGKMAEARCELERLWSAQPRLNAAQYILSCLGNTSDERALVRRKLAILRSFTVEPLIPLLRAECLLRMGLDLEVRTGDFNTYVQEILSTDSFLDEFKPDAVILAIQTRDLVPELWEHFADLSESGIREVVDRTLADIENWITQLRRRTNAGLLIHNLDEPGQPRLGILDRVLEHTQAQAIGAINDGIRRIARSTPGTYPFDYHALVARWGREDWYDERKWMLARMPVAANHLTHLAQEWARYLAAMFGRTAKVVVTDLDNTLWGGILGEDGAEGIRCDREYPGAFYRNVQRTLLDLNQRGFLLAIASKNNPDEVLQVLEKSPEMLLRPRHFASIRCNWLDKATNLREIAAELNVGLDSLAFIDDNPVERDLIRKAIPEVAVIELPPEAEGYERAIRDSPLLERLWISQEDRERGRYYTDQRDREELRSHSKTLTEFFHGLRQEVEIGPVTPDMIGRVAQLTMKTNQFNLTTRRYSEAEIRARLGSNGCDVYQVRVRDRFGDNGVVGVCITERADAACEIDTLLLSCRVIGRTVETALLSVIAKQNQARGIRYLRGWFLPTKKNLPAQDFYRSHGFHQVRASDEGTLWELDLTKNAVECPSWISLTCRPEVMERELNCAS